MFSSIDVPGPRRTLVDAVLDSGTVSGIYTDSQGVHRGYVMDARGCVTAVDQQRYPGLTVVRGLNAKRDLVGRYADGAGIRRGYLIRGYRSTDVSPECWRGCAYAKLACERAIPALGRDVTIAFQGQSLRATLVGIVDEVSEPGYLHQCLSASSL